MMLFLPLFESEAQREMRRARAEARAEAPAVPWVSNIRWEDFLKIQAETFPTYSLFSVPPTRFRDPEASEEAGECEISPRGRWMYRERVLRANTTLATYSGSKRGEVCFDNEIRIPLIHAKRCKGWREDPWMSLTPMEYLSLRPGIRKAKGTVVVAGLGLGYMLVEVCKRKKVKKVILVERDQELIDWILPKLDLNGKEVEIVVGDAYEEIPKLTADVALIDIAPSYGNNTFMASYRCPNIGDIWVWGAARTG